MRCISLLDNFEKLATTALFIPTTHYCFHKRKQSSQSSFLGLDPTVRHLRDDKMVRNSAELIDVSKLNIYDFEVIMLLSPS